MAKVGVRAKRAKLVEESRRNPLATEEANVGAEPVWNAEEVIKLTDEEFETRVRRALNYYNYFYKVKDLRKFLSHWAKESKLFTTADLDKLKRAADNDLTLTACSIAKAHNKGMPIRARQKEYLTEIVTKAIASVSSTAPEAAKPVAEAKAPTIQDRIAEKLSETIGELEGELDNAIVGKGALCKVYDFLTLRKVPQAAVGKIREVFKKQSDEIELALSGKDADLKEAYSYLTKAQIKRITEFFKTLYADLDLYVAAKKATKKVRAVKTPSKEKQVARVKYQKESTELKIKSVTPMSIIGAKVVWCYHTKYRKLQRYVADTHGGSLGVKGTTITGFDTVNSVSKTLRKPAEQLKTFMGAGKVALRTFMKDIKAVECKLNGRLSEDVLILKVE